MKEVCVINKGENLKKIEYNTGIIFDLEYLEEKIVSGLRCVEIRQGKDDIIVVKNYNPYIIKKCKDNETLLDIYAKGYQLIGGNKYEKDNIIIKRAEGVKYNVKPLEKIEDIADKFGVSKSYIIATNNLKTDKLFIGQVILI